MRLTLTVLGRTVLDVRVLEDDDEDPEPGGSTSETTIDGSPAPFGFRPTPDQWPPSWE